MTESNRTALILLSDKRSGSTMVQDELCRHPDIARVNYSSHTYFETQHWLKAAALLDRPGALYSGGKTYPAYSSKATARRYMIDTINGNLSEFKIPSSNRELAFSGWQNLCDEFAKPVFFEKSPQYPANWGALSLLMEWAEKAPMQVKYLFLFRNPQAVQYSAEKLFRTPPRMRQFGWLEAQRNLLACQAMISQNQQMSIRYEEIVKNPREMFAKICDFTGVSSDASLGENVSAGSLDKWKNDPGFTLKLDPSVAQLANALGYTNDELDNPNGVAGDVNDNRSVSVRASHFMSRAHHEVLRPIKMWLANRK